MDDHAEDDALAPSEEVSLQEGPFRVAVTAARLDAACLAAEVTHATAGAVSIFLGTTRNNFRGREVTRLEYEAHSRMAAKQMLAICREAQAAAGGALVQVVCVHRVGLVPVAEASIGIAASSPHRREALAAVGYILDEVKARAAVWKREVYADGGRSWKENCECGWRAPAGHGQAEAEGGSVAALPARDGQHAVDRGEPENASRSDAAAVRPAPRAQANECSTASNLPATVTVGTGTTQAAHEHLHGRSHAL
jgi:molybdopterin synthase catalytic subunit